MPRVMHRNCAIAAHFVYPYYPDFRLKRCVKVGTLYAMVLMSGLLFAGTAPDIRGSDPARWPRRIGRVCCPRPGV
jgi:hypothetical protein